MFALLLACNRPVATPPTPAVDPRPNIVLFTLDTVRADMIGAYGSSQATPRIDALAKEGITFTRAYTVTPLTIPAHSSLFTGMWPTRHGVRDNGDFFLGPDAHTLAEALQASGYQTMASVGAEVTSHHWGFEQGFDAFHDDLREPEENRWRVERRGDQVIADALKWMDAAPTSEPFFAWIHMYDAHHPYRAPAELQAQFPGRPYLAEIAYVDHQVGEIVDRLRGRGQLENTWIFVMADHGEGMGSHGEAMHGVLLYDATTHIPLVVRPPGGTAPRRVDTAVSLVDIFPTIAAIAKAPAPTGVDGQDLGPVLASAEGLLAPRDGVYLESLYAFRHYGWAPQHALVDDRHKLLVSSEPELYERGDVEEDDDLAAKNASAVQGLKERLDKIVIAESTGVSEAASMSSDRLQQLAALGYVTAVATEPVDPSARLPDPKDRIPFLAEVERTRQALQEGDLKKARERAEAALAQEPGLTDLQVLYAQILTQDGDPEKALAVLEPLGESGSAQVLAQLGQLHMMRGDPELALVELERATGADPYLAAAWVPYLHALFLSGDIERFTGAAMKAGPMFPKEGAVQGMYGLALVLLGNPKQAEPILVAALTDNPLIPFANHALGVIAKEQGDTAKAEDFLLEEIRVHAPAVPARRTLVEIYAGEARYEEQLTQLDAIAKAAPPDVLTHHSRAQALFNLGRYTEAEKSVEQCRELAPSYPACALLEANVLKKLGRDEAAQKAYEAAIELAKVVEPTIRGKTNTPETKTPETKAPEAKTPDTKTPDTNTAETKPHVTAKP